MFENIVEDDLVATATKIYGNMESSYMSVGENVDVEILEALGKVYVPSGSKVSDLSEEDYEKLVYSLSIGKTVIGPDVLTEESAISATEIAIENMSVYSFRIASEDELSAVIIDGLYLSMIENCP